MNEHATSVDLPTGNHHATIRLDRPDIFAASHERHDLRRTILLFDSLTALQALKLEVDAVIDDWIERWGNDDA